MIIAACVASVSCEQYFDISGQVGDGTIWMTFIPSNDSDITYFCLQATTPLAGETTPVNTEDESVEVLVNGKTLKLERDKYLPSRVKIYSTEYGFKPGDVVETKAIVPYVGKVTAECVVPEAFPSFDWTTRVIPRDESHGAIVVNIQYDGSNEDDYYGVALIQHCETAVQWEETDPQTGKKYWGKLEYETRETFLPQISIIDSNGLSAAGEEPVIVTPQYHNTLSERHPSVQIWDDPGRESKDRHHFEFASSFHENSDRYSEKYDGVRGRRIFYKYRYRLALYRFSESCYSYLKAQYNQMNDEFSSIGLAPPTFVYSNVHGGSGVCGAYTVRYSDWIDIN